MADYLLCFLSAEAQETSYYDANFTVAKVNLIIKALNPGDTLKPMGQIVKQFASC